MRSHRLIHRISEIILHIAKYRFIVRKDGRAAIGMVSLASKIVLPYQAVIANRTS